MQTEKQREKSHVAARRTAATGLSTAQRKCDWPLEEPQRLWAAAVEDQACPPGRRPCLRPLHQGWVPGVPLGTKPGRPQLQSSTKVSIGPRGAERQAQGGRYGAPGPPWHGGATGKHIAPCQELAYPRVSHRPALRSPHLAPSHPGPTVYKSALLKGSQPASPRGSLSPHVPSVQILGLRTGCLKAPHVLMLDRRENGLGTF